MAESRAEFKQRLSRLPKRQVFETFEPDFTDTRSVLAPLSYFLSGAIGFILFLVLPHLLMSFAAPANTADVPTASWAFDPIWTIPCVGLAFTGSIVVMAILGLTSGGHFRAAGVGIALGLGLMRLFAG